METPTENRYVKDQEGAAMTPSFPEMPDTHGVSLHGGVPPYELRTESVEGCATRDRKRLPTDSGGAFWVLCDLADRNLLPVTTELLGCAANLAEKRGRKVWAILLGAGVGHIVPVLWEYGADTVLLLDDPALDGFHDEIHADLVVRMVKRYRPEILLTGATAVGRALAPRVAIALNCGLTADCTGLDIDQESGALLQTRPAFGGSLMATIRSDRVFPQMATVRPGVMKALSPRPGASGTVVCESFEPTDLAECKHLEGRIPGSEGASNFGNASFIVAGGRGMKGAAGFRLLSEFASMLGGVVGASRAAVDAGWAPFGMQIGQTGRTVQPRIYLACGISGQIQHMVGMQSSDRIIAINRDPNAPIMKMADLAIVGDAFEIIPEMMRQMRQTRNGIIGLFTEQNDNLSNTDEKRGT
jgi:electron transfer flavoprotein alpha subunit